MIPADLLDKFREEDPELWVRYTNNDFVGEVSEAWLLCCLMQAIRARGWGYAIGRSSKGMTSASVYAQEGEGKTVMGYDEAEDLLRAYLSARSREAEDKA
jgi:hypothetical protein